MLAAAAVLAATAAVLAGRFVVLAGRLVLTAGAVVAVTVPLLTGHAAVQGRPWSKISPITWENI